MTGTLLVTLGSLLMLVLLIGGMWIPFAVGIGGLLMLILYEGIGSLNSLGFVIWGSINSATLSSVPLFILMAEVLLRSGVSTKFYDGLTKFSWMLPGGIMQSNIAGCAIFSAISGSSVATAAAIGGVALPRAKEEGYDTAMSTGSVAAGGTLGILIPPSIPMVIYASFTEVSIAKLFAASMVPGILLTVMFMAYIAIRVLRDPTLAPKGQRPGSLGVYIAGLVQTVPILIIIGFVLGTIYLGIATPTESAAVGTVASFIFAAILGRPPLRVYLNATILSVKVSAALLLITFCAYIFSYAVETTGVGEALTQWVVGLDLNRYVFLIVLFLMYGIMGCIVDSIGMIVLTVPLLVPILIAMDIDLIWFGIMLVVVVELGQITPPMGINLLVVEAMARTGLGPVVRGVIPYYFIIAAFMVLLTVFPGIALWFAGRI
jgi:tripartite ATP-independent transporter DctM subunit